MDSSERLAEAYLKGLGLGEVVYEPDGNVPPDFLIGGRIAVEVRRLNQNFEHEEGYEGLETAEASIIRYVEKLLPTFGPAIEGKGWWVFYHFWRPIDLKALKSEMKQALAAIKKSPPDGNLVLKLRQNMELEFMPGTTGVDDYFELGGYDDREAGGWIGSEIIRNLNLCIAEKTRKIEPYRSRYPEWWLALPDMIGPDLDPDERALIQGSVDLQGWDRVILLHPRDPTRALLV